MYYTRVTILEQVGYREWTESLGSDREWFIQGVQAELYAALQSIARKYGAFPMATRYDYMIILSSNVRPEDHSEILEVVRGYSKVGVRMASSCGLTPLEAEMRAFKLLAETSIGGFTYSSCPGEEIVVVAHLDINDVTSVTLNTGVIRTYHKVVKLAGRLAEISESYGGVVQYLGGDNILVILPTMDYMSLVERLVREEDLKAGVGISRTARGALELAAKALHEIRVKRGRRVTAYISI